MNKDIKDYLHLYLGCECIVKLPKEYTAWMPQPIVLAGIDMSFAFPCRMRTGDYLFAESFSEVKPILRPLSDMTEEEKTEVAKTWTWYDGMQIVGEEHFNIRHQINHEMVEKALDFTNEDDGDRMSPLAYYQILPYLLKQGFDLFGLIESGLAIDKTKLNSK